MDLQNELLHKLLSCRGRGKLHRNLKLQVDYTDLLGYADSKVIFGWIRLSCPFGGLRSQVEAIAETAYLPNLRFPLHLMQRVQICQSPDGYTRL